MFDIPFTYGGLRFANPPYAGSSGNAIAVWHQDDSPGYSIYVNRYMVSTDSWDATAMIISDVTAGSSTADPQIAMDSSGNAIVVWAQDNFLAQKNIYANRFNN